MHYINAVILGILEGITEFLPISSTGHLALGGALLGVPQTPFIKSFEIIIQLGAILAVCVLYVEKIISQKNLWKKILSAFVPTALAGYFLYSFVVERLLGNITVIAWALFLGGVILLFFERWYAKREARMHRTVTMVDAVVIGIVQIVAMIPGVSRSGATIVGGLLRGIRREHIVEFSFLLAIPTMGAATVLDLMKSPIAFAPQEYLFLLIGFVSAFVSAFIVAQWFVRFIQTNSFRGFAWYRIILGGLLLYFIYLW